MLNTVFGFQNYTIITIPNFAGMEIFEYMFLGSFLNWTIRCLEASRNGTFYEATRLHMHKSCFLTMLKFKICLQTSTDTAAVIYGSIVLDNN